VFSFVVVVAVWLWTRTVSQAGGVAAEIQCLAGTTRPLPRFSRELARWV